MAIGAWRSGRSRSDESLEEFVRRRFGSEICEKIAEPLLGGIYMAPARRLSVRAAFPQLLGSAERSSAGEPLPAFLSLRGGMGELVSAIVARLRRALILTGRRATSVEPGFRVACGDESHLFDALILAVPAPGAAELMRSSYAELASGIARIPFSGSVTVSLAYPRSAIPHPLDGTGFVVTRAEKRRLVACSWSSEKYEGRSPPEQALLRCFFGGAFDPDALELEDAALVAIAREELRSILGIETAPLLHRVFRWPAANPVYEVGHLDRVAAILERLPPGLKLTGASYRGIGLPDCIADARRAARELLSAQARGLTSSGS